MVGGPSTHCSRKRTATTLYGMRLGPLPPKHSKNNDNDNTTGNSPQEQHTGPTPQQPDIHDPGQATSSTSAPMTDPHATLVDPVGDVSLGDPRGSALNTSPHPPEAPVETDWDDSADWDWDVTFDLNPTPPPTSPLPQRPPRREPQSTSPTGTRDQVPGPDITVRDSETAMFTRHEHRGEKLRNWDLEP